MNCLAAQGTIITIIIINNTTIKSPSTGRRRKKTVTQSTRKVRKLSPVPVIEEPVPVTAPNLYSPYIPYSIAISLLTLPSDTTVPSIAYSYCITACTR